VNRHALFIALLLPACGHTLQVDPDFRATVEDFERTAASVGADVAVDDLVVEYGETSNAAAGATCYRRTMHTPRIAVDRGAWDAMTDAQKREALFHEMGHCVLNREHTTERYPQDNCPRSIMAPSPVGDWCRNAHGEEYDRELFGGEK